MNYTREMTKEEILQKVYEIEHQLLSMAGELDKIYRNLYYKTEVNDELYNNMAIHSKSNG